MRTKTLALALTVAASAPAVAFDYSFDGILANHFEPLPFNDDRIIVEQRNGQLEVHTEGYSGDTDSGSGVIHRQFLPRYDQSWSASVDASIPARYNAFEGPSDVGFEFVTAGIAVLSAPNGFDTDFNVLAPVLEVRRLLPAFGEQRVLLATPSEELEGVEIPTALETVRLRIDYDSESKQLRSFANDSLFFSVAIDQTGPLDWEMTDSDTFRIAVFGDSKFEAIAADVPVTLDNFSATLLVPEPTTSTLVSFTSCVCLLLRRRCF